MLGSFTLTSRGSAVPLGVDARRLVAYLAVHPRPQERAALAADLWPGTAAEAAARLLSDAIAAVDVPGLLTEDGPTLSLAADVEVDLADALGLVRGLPEIPVDDTPDISLLSSDILPGWTATWIAVERERFRQLRLHAIEERSLRLSAAGAHAEAVALAESAVRVAPSRESARRALIEAHLAQGNIAAAVAQYDDYRELLRSSVGGPDPSGLDGLVLPTAPVWPMLRARRPMPRSAVQLPGLRSVRGAGGGRRLVAGGSVPGTTR
ncbi:AfsR/SARP family transcriptional regulator [Pseudonocardia humida]|uniref:Bacterial transcriptional activator domain-containing protein n=1 Tax=Pseudonocardia humida TaxID=2800819 RepID=A0ABT1A685_9PSEU|nr:bacterial transcriptional activator domain-containing protein [Pseudonocardia humida]MCO1658428.1 bacterial transcriptional activator domain-containing protein [Pseudonocardia humida]